MSPFVDWLRRLRLYPRKEDTWRAKGPDWVDEPIPARLKVEINHQQVGMSLTHLSAAELERGTLHPTAVLQLVLLAFAPQKTDTTLFIGPFGALGEGSRECFCSGMFFNAEGWALLHRWTGVRVSAVLMSGAGCRNQAGLLCGSPERPSALQGKARLQHLAPQIMLMPVPSLAKCQP